MHQKGRGTLSQDFGSSGWDGEQYSIVCVNCRAYQSGTVLQLSLAFLLLALTYLRYIILHYMYIDCCAYPLVCVSPSIWPSGCGKGLTGGVTGSCTIGAACSQKERMCDQGIK